MYGRRLAWLLTFRVYGEERIRGRRFAVVLAVAPFRDAWMGWLFRRKLNLRATKEGAMMPNVRRSEVKTEPLYSSIMTERRFSNLLRVTFFRYMDKKLNTYTNIRARQLRCKESKGRI